MCGGLLGGRLRRGGLLEDEILVADIEAVAVAQPRGPDHAAIVAVRAVAAGKIDEPEFAVILRMNEGVSPRGLRRIDDDVIFRAAPQAALAMQRPALALAKFQPRATGVDGAWIGGGGHGTKTWGYRCPTIRAGTARPDQGERISRTGPAERDHRKTRKDTKRDTALSCSFVFLVDQISRSLSG